MGVLLQIREKRARLRMVSERLNAIAPMLDFRMASSRGKRPMVRRAGIRIDTLKALAKSIASEHGVSVTSIWRWYGSFLRSGYTALARDIRSDKGKSRYFARNQHAAALAWQYYVMERLPISSVFCALRRDLGTTAPCYKTVRDYLETLHSARRRNNGAQR